MAKDRATGDTTTAAAIARPSLRLAGSVVDSAVLGAGSKLLERTLLAGGSSRLRTQLLSTALSALYNVVLPQTLGKALLGTRIVDRQTLGPPSRRQTILRWALPASVDLVMSLLPRPQVPPEIDELRTEAERLRQEHGGDRQKLDEEPVGGHSSFRVNPLKPLLPLLARVLLDVLVEGGVARGPLHTGLHDRVAGTVVVSRSVRGRRDMLPAP